MTDVMGLAEVADLLGVTPQAVSNWRARPRLDFPAPRYELRMGPVWHDQAREILAWFKEHRRRH